jgi:hypothetical protein
MKNSWFWPFLVLLALGLAATGSAGVEQVFLMCKSNETIDDVGGSRITLEHVEEWLKVDLGQANVFFGRRPVRRKYDRQLLRIE